MKAGKGHYELVKLNLRDQEVVNYILECVDFWVNEFDIDGLRLDVAYCLDQDFLKTLRYHCNQIKEDFVLIGELLHRAITIYSFQMTNFTAAQIMNAPQGTIFEL